MTDVVSSILQWLNTHPEYSWLITFIISAGESVAIIGTIVPGSITMTALGALAGSGVIPLWSTIFWAFLGAIVGDGISYWMGYYFKDRICKMWPFRENLSLLAKGERFFNKYGGMGVFIGRFIGPIRALIPVVAGMMGMRPWHFLFWNVVSAAGWAPAYMLPGILLGAASLELPPDIATRVILIFFFWLLFILLCLWLIRKIPLVIHHQIMHFAQKIWTAVKRSPTQEKCLLKLLRHHNPQKIPLQLTLTFYFLIMCGIFIFLAHYIYSHHSADLLINQCIYHLFRGIYTPEGRDIMIYITMLGQKQVLAPAACIIVIWFLITRQWHIAWHVLGLFILTVAAVVGIKHGVHSLRPWGVALPPESFSFPSGHTTLTTTFYIGLALLMSQAYTGYSRRLFYALIALIIAAVSISRLYLGAHWLTDILGGWILSIALVTLVTISFNRKAVTVNPRRLLALTLLILGIVYIFVAQYYFPRLQASFTQLDLPIQETTIQAWDQQDEDYLPEQRVSLFGFPSQAINIEWMGNLSVIEKTLARYGWKVPTQADWLDVLFRISGIESAEHLPLVSPFYLDKKPALVMIRNNFEGKRLLVLRLWHSNIILQETKQPLWVGVVGLVPKTYGWLSHRSKMDIEITPELVFNHVKPAGMKIKTINVPVSSKKHRPTQTILLVR